MFKRKSFFQKEIPIREWVRKIFKVCFDNIYFKRVALFICEYFGRFLSVCLVFGFYVIYIMYKVPLTLWGANSVHWAKTTAIYTNWGASFIYGSNFSYMIFIFFPFMPILIGFLVLSIFLWTYFHKDKAISHIGFKNTIIALLSIFVIFFIAAKSGQMENDIRMEQENEAIKYKQDFVSVSRGVDSTTLKLYQGLADEGLEVWRKDPIAVVQNEIDRGTLNSYSREDDKLILGDYVMNKDGSVRSVTVFMENEDWKLEIILNQYWVREDGIWYVNRYKKTKV